MNIQVKSLLFGLTALVAMSFVTTTADHGAARWELLGVRKIDHQLDRDEIIVTRAEGVFSALKLKIKRSPINMHKMAIHFGNGEVQEIDMRTRFAAGSESRLIDLPGNRRTIQKVVFWYDTKNMAIGKGLIELWGRH